MNFTEYLATCRNILLIEPGETASLREIADADLVVYADSGRVMKDRHGALRTLEPSELDALKRTVAERAAAKGALGDAA